MTFAPVAWLRYGDVIPMLDGTPYAIAWLLEVIVGLFVDVLFDSVKDTAELVPFLFITYLAMEALEHASEGVSERFVARAGAAGPAVGALLGALPQCGFSAMASTLFAGGVVTAGTLIAVILSTSDELVPVFLAQGAGERILPVVALKVVIGMVAGFAIDLVMRMFGHAGVLRPHIHDLCENAGCSCNAVDAHDHTHGRAGRERWKHIIRSATVHTAQVTVFIFLIGLVLGLVIEGVGSNTLASVLSAHPVRATFLAALVGLIPNCGASVAIAQLYLDGSLATGPMVAGLLASGGVGLLVLFRTNSDMRQNLAITVLVYAVGVACGLVVGASGIVF